MPEVQVMETNSMDRTCTVCGNVSERIEIVDGIPACYDCVRDSGLFERCHVCGDWHSVDEMVGRSPICQRCLDARPDRQRDYASWAVLDHREAVGVEIECFNKDMTGGISRPSRDHPELRYFNFVHDASVTRGEEMVSCPIPLSSAKDFFAKLSWMPREYKVDRSCGLHVHVNLKPWVDVNGDATLPEIGEAFKKLTLGFMKLENYLYETQPMFRREGSYAKRFERRYRTREWPSVALTYSDIRAMTPSNVVRAWYGSGCRSKRSIPVSRYHDSRYTWVNLNSIMVKNTCEIRLHTGSVNARKIRLWATAMAKLVKHFMLSSYDAIDAFTVDDLKHILSKDEYKYLEERRAKFASQ
jgi:hypothetical protein